jgi:hypothetical protein
MRKRRIEGSYHGEGESVEENGEIEEVEHGRFENDENIIK